MQCFLTLKTVEPQKRDREEYTNEIVSPDEPFLDCHRTSVGSHSLTPEGRLPGTPRLRTIVGALTRILV